MTSKQTCSSSEAIRTLSLGVLLLSVATNCTPEPNMPEQPLTNKGLLPRWQVGQSWRVEYRSWRPSPEKGPVHSPPPPQKTVWRYEVIAGHAVDEAKVLSVKEENGKRAFEMTFD